MFKHFLSVACLLCTSSAGRVRTRTEKTPQRRQIHEKTALAQFLLAQPFVARAGARNYNLVSRKLPSQLRISEISMLTAEDDAMIAWQEMLDALAKATAAMNEVTSKAAEIADLDAKCAEGDDRACEVLSSEEEKKRAWLAKQDAPAWGTDATAVSQVLLSREEEAKKAWLAKLDASSWRKVASTVSHAAATTATSSLVPEGSSYIDSLKSSSEEEAKQRWLAKQDENKPAWGRRAATPPASAISSKAGASAVPEGSSYIDRLRSSSEEEAKMRWLASRDADQPTWGKRAATSATTAGASAVPEQASYLDSLKPSSEEEAKKRWLASREENQPAWGRRSAASFPAASATTSQAGASASYMDSLMPSSEEEAKRRWLAKQDGDKPAWGKRR